MDNAYSSSETNPVFKSICSHWLTKIKAATDHKKRVFQVAADEALSFYNGPRSWDEMMNGAGGVDSGGESPSPTFKMSVNKTFEFVSIFGPAMYYDDPVRTVKPRMPVVVPAQFFPDPMFYQALMQQESQRVMIDGLRGVLLEAYLNWTPAEYGLSGESRLSISESLIKGRGCAWTELYSPPGATLKAVRTSYDTTDNLLVDPDAPSLSKAKWIARKCVHPVWQVERDYGLRPGSLKGNLESQAKQADLSTSDDADYDRKQGRTNDLIVYWKIFSKMGVGGRLQGIKQGYRGPLEIFGDYNYLVIAENAQFPLNLPPDVQNDPSFQADPTKVFAKLAWPTPFWAGDAWPVSELDFYPVHNCPWPLPPIKAGMGELKFLNWAMSFLAGHVWTTAREFIAVKKSVGEEIKTQLLEGKDLTLLEVELENGQSISDYVQFLQHPAINGDIWKLIEAVEANFDKRVGLTELMYGNGGQTQIRSAAEVSLRNQNMSVRPDDMSKQVEAWQSSIAAKEAFCARFHLIPEDIEPILGQVAAMAWGQYVATKDIQVACHQLEYQIEAGSTRRPNKEFQIKQMTEAMTTMSPIFQAYAQMTGDMIPLNNLLADYAKSRDLDPARYQLRAPMMAPAAPAGEPGSEGPPQAAA